jgi:hypothetical protein
MFSLHPKHALAAGKVTVGLETIMTDAVFSKFVPFTVALIVNGAIIAGMSYLFDLEINYGTGVCAEGKSCSGVCHDIYRDGDALRALSAPSIVKDLNAISNRRYSSIRGAGSNP